MKPLRDRLGSAGALLAPGAGGFLTWWANALASWLPLRQRQALSLQRGRLLLLAGADAVQLRLQYGAELRDLGSMPPPAAPGAAERIADTPFDPLARLLTPRIVDLPRALLLPAGVALRRQMVLPVAAAERLRDVVGFEIDRQTPFSADAVAFDARILRRREGAPQLDVELVAVPRAALTAQLAALGPLAATLAGVDVAGADGVPLGINLLPEAQRQRRQDPWRTWNWVLAGVAVFALAAGLWQVLENRRAAADVTEARLKQLAAPARKAAAERQVLVDLIEGQAFLDQTRAQRPGAVEIINELTRRLPDGTYLEKLAIEGDRLTLIGLSNEAPALIGRLQGTPLWRSPALTGALQPDPSSGRDRFTLTAEIGSASPASKEAARGAARTVR